ncbi:MAG TPA: DPP IV N-terminal domain-containing protein [Fimbriimonadaceae bacterium]|nr:DPP IV N-terminal domain-containing protein [Fimbriimonadaceae bacterium]
MKPCRLILSVLALASAATLFAQDRLAGLVDTSKTAAKRSELQKAMKIARPDFQWTSGTTLAVEEGSDWYEFDAKTGKKKKMDEAPEREQRQRPSDPNGKRRRPDRGRQYEEEFSPDGKQRVFYRDGNMWVSDADGKNESAITTEGDESKRVKFGSASWVYGEELRQRDAMGWSPDGKKVWFYRFDDGQAKDYFVTLHETDVQNALEVDAYPKAGAPNPTVDLYTYDFATKKRTKIKVRPGEFDEGIGHYVYGISWSPDSKELRFHRTNRWQNTMEFCAADPATGDVRVIVREEWPQSWTENMPDRTYLDDDPNISKAEKYRGKMIWTSARTGFDNYYLIDIATGATVALTNLKQDVINIERIDLVAGTMDFTAAGPDNPYMIQLYTAKLDGSGAKLVTDESFSHSVDISPSGEYFVDTAETLNSPPRVTLRKINGQPVTTIAASDISAAIKAGFRPAQRIVFTAADGKTQCYGSLQFPADFDQAKKYPVIVDIYGGPESTGYREQFLEFDRKGDYGFITAHFAGRGTRERGKAFMDAVYLKLGQAEIDDEAAGVKKIAELPYVDGTRVGITGTSYGGYSSCMCLLRYPDVFAASVSCSSVTDWRNYDTIYTERYMRTPQANPEGYKAGAHVTYAKDLKGWLMLYYGTADNNVHPSNTFQLIKELQRDHKYFELQVGPDFGHSGMNFDRMMEFFVERLTITGPRR